MFIWMGGSHKSEHMYMCNNSQKNRMFWSYTWAARKPSYQHFWISTTALSKDTKDTQGFIWCLVEIPYFFMSDLVVYRGRNGMSTNIKFSFYMPMTQWEWIWFTTLKSRKIPHNSEFMGLVGLFGYWLYNCYGPNKKQKQADGIVGTWSHH